MDEVRSARGWFKVVGGARVEARGPDAVKFINNLCTNDVARLPDGDVCEACFCNAKGGTVEHAWLRKAGAAVEIELDSGRGGALLKHLDRYLIREKVVLRDRTAETCCFHVFGAAAETLPAGIAGAVLRRPRTPHAGFDVIAEVAAAPALRAALGAGEIDAAAAEALRVAAGIPVFGIDFPEGTLPQELDRTTSAISFTKGCYIGQETVARLDAYGHVNKILRGLVLAGHAATGAAILLGEKEVGKLGSAALQPDGHWFGLAIVRVAAAAPGTAVVVGEVAAKIAALPFG